MSPSTNDYLSELTQLLQAENAKIAEESTVEDSLIALQASNAAVIADLQAKVLAAVVDPAVAQTIRDLFAANATALQANVDKANAAVVANTPSDPNAPSETPADPTDPNTPADPNLAQARRRR